MSAPSRSKQGTNIGVDSNDKGVGGHESTRENNAATLATSLARFEAAFREVENNILAGKKIPRLLDFFPLNRSKSLNNLFARLDKFFRGKEYETNLLLARALRDVLTVHADVLAINAKDISQQKDALAAYGGGLLEQTREIQKQGHLLSEHGEELLDQRGDLQKQSHLLSEHGEELLDQRGDLQKQSHLLSEHGEELLDQRGDLQKQSHLLSEHGEELLDQRRELQKQGYFLSEDEHRRLDALYADFENRFRGSQNEIRQRQNIYLPFIREALAETKEGLVVDIGSGRGEWLESLREDGFQGVGIEANSIAVKTSQEKGLKVIEGDALAYLRGVPDGSLAAITCFHVVEHLPFHVLVQLLNEMVRTLRVGGIAILETPNPQNVLVGSHNFYYDPTHRNPLPSLTLKFLAEASGLSRVEAFYLHPYPDSYKVEGSALAERFNEYFYCAQDYAVLGYK